MIRNNHEGGSSVFLMLLAGGTHAAVRRLIAVELSMNGLVCKTASADRATDVIQTGYCKN